MFRITVNLIKFLDYISSDYIQYYGEKVSQIILPPKCESIKLSDPLNDDLKIVVFKPNSRSEIRLCNFGSNFTSNSVS